jgi:hypothetical protein
MVLACHRAQAPPPSVEATPVTETSEPDAPLDPTSASSARAGKPGFDLVAQEHEALDIAAPIIEFPRAGDALTLDQAKRAPLRVRGAASVSGARIGLVLDDFRIRYLDAAESVVLSDLVPADRDLEAGAHCLVAVVALEGGGMARDASGRVISATATFSVEAPGELAASRLVYLEPQGTFNGSAAAERARLEFLEPNPGEGAKVQVTIAGPKGAGSWEVHSRVAYAIGPLDNGDYDVTLRVLDSSGAETHRAGRTITVNLDAPFLE